MDHRPEILKTLYRYSGPFFGWFTNQFGSRPINLGNAALVQTIPTPLRRQSHLMTWPSLRSCGIPSNAPTGSFGSSELTGFGFPTRIAAMQWQPGATWMPLGQHVCIEVYIYILYYISKYIIDVWICGYMRVKYALIMHFLVWNICFRSSIIHTSHHIALSPAYLKRTWFCYPGTSSSHNILLILDS